MSLDYNVNYLTMMFYFFNQKYYTKILTVRLGCVYFAMYIVSFYVLFVISSVGITGSQLESIFWYD